MDGPVPCAARPASDRIDDDHDAELGRGHDAATHGFPRRFNLLNQFTDSLALVCFRFYACSNCLEVV